MQINRNHAPSGGKIRAIQTGMELPMLFESIKKRITSRLIDEISALDPMHLELVGHGLVELLENKRLVHHGINKDYQFVGYTVDSFSDDSTIIAQYSTESGYFKDTGIGNATVYQKIEQDVRSAEKHRPRTGATKIYLMSTEEEIPSFRAKFNSTTLAQELGDALIILDAREIARRIYDLAGERPDAATFFRAFFPEFGQALDNFEYFGRLPAQCANHQSNESALAALRNHFAGGRSVAVLHGLSGSGKTQAAIDFVHHEEENFDNYIWLASGDWHPDTSLSAVTRVRGGKPLNVVGSFNSAKTILVVDRLDQAVDPTVFAELQTGFGKGGVVIVTSQIAVPDARSHVPLPRLSREVAMRILGEDPAQPREISQRFVDACIFLPLVLATARSVIESQGIERDEFYEDVLASPEVLSGNDGVSILRGILRRLNGAPLAALEKIANSGLAMHDGGFLNHFIRNVPKSELQKLAFLSPASVPGVLVVHDLVCQAVRTADSSKDMVSEVERYIDKLQGEMSPSALRQIHLSRAQLLAEHNRRGERAPDWLLYALLQIEETKHEVFGSYASKPIIPDGSLAALMATIDAREQYAYTLNHQDRPNFYAVCAKEYEHALGNAVGRNEAELLHHLGKTYRRLGKVDQALSTFEQLLELEPTWHATHGQIAHLGTQYEATPQAKAAGQRSLHRLVTQMLDDPAAVPLRVAMAALSSLRSYPVLIEQLNGDENTIKVLGEVISQAALEGLDQFYDAFFAFTSKFSYRHPSVSFALVSAVGDMFEVSPASIGKKHLLSVSESLANVAQSAQRSGDEALARRLSGLSVVYAETLLADKVPDSYATRGIAKVFTIAGQPDRALRLIDDLPSKDVNHWVLYRRAEAELALQLPESLQTARAALAGAQGDERAAKNLASYFDMVSRCLRHFGNIPDAIEHARLAIKHSDGAQYQQELSDRLTALEKMSLLPLAHLAFR
ncbi:tetratricopeptide repeat protein [Pseudomonas sp. 1121_17]